MNALRRGRRSLRLRATLLLVGAVATLWLIAAAFTWRAAEHEAAEIFDGHLAQAASMLIAQASLEIGEPEALEDHDESHHLGGEIRAPLTHRYARKVAFQVWDHGSLLLVHSDSAPATRLGTVDEGFSDNRIDGVDWRVFSAWTAGRHQLVQVGERAEARRELANEIAFGLLAPLLWALPLMAVLVWWAVSRALAPLSALCAAIAERTPDRLDALPIAGVPSEVEPLVQTLNALLARVGAALVAEKRFTGDAAHELRTPLAALSAQAQVALAERDPSLRDKALRAVLAAAERQARLVGQLLTLSRADSTLAADWPEIDLAALVRQTVAEMAPAALASGIDIAVEAPERLPVRGESGWLGVLLRNLIDNAVRHSPKSGVVGVFLQGGAGGARVEVRDAGPGVPETLRVRLGERFWRGEGETAGGSGLGLSIARRVADLHGASLEFASAPEGGLMVTLELPARAIA